MLYEVITYFYLPSTTILQKRQLCKKIILTLKKALIMTTFAKTMQTYKTALLGLLLSLVMISCDKDRNKPGKSYFPDMEQSQAYETYSQSPVMADGKTNQLPPKT